MVRARLRTPRAKPASSHPWRAPIKAKTLATNPAHVTGQADESLLMCEGRMASGCYVMVIKESLG